MVIRHPLPKDAHPLFIEQLENVLNRIMLAEAESLPFRESHLRGKLLRLRMDLGKIRILGRGEQGVLYSDDLLQFAIRLAESFERSLRILRSHRILCRTIQQCKSLRFLLEKVGNRPT